MSEHVSNWQSAHFFSDFSLFSVECDDVILRFVRPLCDEVCRILGKETSIFFIRYSELGPHLRIRWRTERYSEVCPSREAVGTAVSLWNTTNSRKLRLDWVPYIPEVQRYGGPEFLPCCEAFFAVSSQCVIPALVDVGENYRRRLGRALLFLIAFAHATCQTKSTSMELFRFAAKAESTLFSPKTVSGEWRMKGSSHHADILESVTELWDLLEQCNSTIDYLDSYHAAARILELQLTQSCKAVHGTPLGLEAAKRNAFGIFCSIMHMTNNRLGVERRDEYILYSIACEALSNKSAT